MAPPLRRWFLLPLLPLLLSPPGFLLGADLRITDLGAIPGAAAPATAVIQSAIDRCSATGGRVVVPAGRFTTGTLYLKSNVELHLERGAVLEGSTRLADYPVNPTRYRSYTNGYVRRALLWAEDQHDIALTGAGTIDGRGEGRFFPFPAEGADADRPYVIRFVNCERVVVQGLTLRNSAKWMQHYLACRDVRLQDLTVFNHANYNNDGLDLDGCQRVLVAGCTFDVDDDGICLKSTSPALCEDISISHCVVSSHCNALKLGTETTGGFRNIVITDCVVTPSREAHCFYGSAAGTSALALEIVDGGVLEDVLVANLAVRLTDTPLFIRLGNRARRYADDAESPGVGRLRRVRITNVTAVSRSPICASITGLPGHPVEDITLENLTLTAPGGGTPADFARPIPEQASTYPDATMFGPSLPASGLYLRHARGITLGNLQLQTAEPDARPALFAQEVAGLEVSRLRVRLPSGALPAVHLEQVREARIDCGAPGGPTSGHVRLQDCENRSIRLVPE